MGVDISVIIPVLNEKTRINKAVNRIYDQDFAGTRQVIVVDGDREGGTIACIRNQAVITLRSRPGRAFQMNSGAKKASGNILLFLHCDTVLPANALDRIRDAMADRQLKAGAFDLSIDGRGAAYRVIETTASIRSRITRIPYGDQAIFIRKAYFFELGQYSPIPIMEDVDLMRRIKRRKDRICFIRQAVVTSSRRWRAEGLVRCSLRNWFLILLYFTGTHPERLARFYKHHSA